jgi:hypothetical protein
MRRRQSSHCRCVSRYTSEKITTGILSDPFNRTATRATLAPTRRGTDDDNLTNRGAR